MTHFQHQFGRQFERYWAAMLLCVWMLTTPASAATPPPFLRAQGPVIVGSDGREVTLRGVNLGGWLVEEMWMQPFETKPPPGTARP